MKRIFVEKRSKFATEARNLLSELNSVLGLDVKSLRLLNIYDINGIDENLFIKSKFEVFAHPATDKVYRNINLKNKKFITLEFLPAQKDNRGEAAEACLKLLGADKNVTVRSGKLFILDEDIDAVNLKKIADYLLNPVECRIKNLDVSSQLMPGFNDKQDLEFISLSTRKDQCQSLIDTMGLSMNVDDLVMIAEFFSKEKRNPTETELRILDTYWSDHCRHKTFNTILDKIEIEESLFSDAIRESYQKWEELRSSLGGQKEPRSLMNLAGIAASYLEKEDIINDIFHSGENNSYGIKVEITNEEGKEPWIVAFKNETHNHPTEIEPFGGAATCLGGAVRDPLSSRAYVYQAARITGAGNIFSPIEETLPGKLPQRVITTKAAKGFSSYGNQLGIPTTLIKEIYHPGYVAKRLEVGAVVGAVKASSISNRVPVCGDAVLILGSRTGRDGIGGATGSSKSHNELSLERCGAEVQKGTPLEEHKLQRLFRKERVLTMIKKCNDFGAGGVAVAIGELASGIEIHLDRILQKYEGLSSLELTLSESQERLAVVIDKGDVELFIKECNFENVECVHVADITYTDRLQIYNNGKLIADIPRSLLDSGGSQTHAKAVVTAPINYQQKSLLSSTASKVTLREQVTTLLSNPNIATQKGLVEMFDSTIGASTILMPFGGMTQRTESQVSLQLIPVRDKKTSTATLLTFGFNPYITEQNPFLGAIYAILECVSKAVAAGADFRKIRFSFQEYFEKLKNAESWGKPLAALLGALKMQLELGLPAIGGKDSMSGTYKELNVPPTFICFGLGVMKMSEAISTEFKSKNSKLYLLNVDKDASGIPETQHLKEAYTDFHLRINKGEIKAAFALGPGGLVEAVAKMSFGNSIGAQISYPEDELFNWNYGTILIETNKDLPSNLYAYIGKTIDSPILDINGEQLPIDELYEMNTQKYSSIFPINIKENSKSLNATGKTEVNRSRIVAQKTSPNVCLPIFPGTNCEFDIAEAFRREGCNIETMVFQNGNSQEINRSIRKFAMSIDNCQILALSGGFSMADEPDGSGKFIASILNFPAIKNAIENLLHRGGLILGICNGFQALLRSGLLPYGKIKTPQKDSPVLISNSINRHVSRIVTLRVASTASPWLIGFKEGDLYSVPVSHSEGRFCVNSVLLNSLKSQGRIAFQYADPATGNATMSFPLNPNGSEMSIDGILSPDGLILGMMSHPERYREGLMKNVKGNKELNIFRNAVKYFNG